MKKTMIYQLFSHSKICIIGGGTGGVNLSSHLLRAKFDPKDIRIFDANDKHYYQPGWTMLGADLCKPDLTVRKMTDILPSEIYHTKQNVASVNADKNQIKTENGETFTYDQLIFASGIKLDYDKIKGAKQALDNPNSKVGTIYNIKYAQKTARLGRQFKGGKAIFTEPGAPIKCAGAPQKILYLLTDIWQKAGISCDISFIKTPAVIFGIPKYAQALTKVAADFGIQCVFKHNLIEVQDKVAIFQNTDTKEKIERPYDFLHLIPPMSAHDYIKQSGLADEAGYLDVDKFSLRHTKHKNIWGLGDCTNTPNSKTAAAVFSQTETLVKNLKQALINPDVKPPSEYEGYASCPLFVGGNKLILAEFKYGGIVDETFFKDQQKPRTSFFLLKRYGFPHIYWQLMPRGLWGGRKGIKIEI